MVGEVGQGRWGRIGHWGVGSRVEGESMIHRVGCSRSGQRGVGRIHRRTWTLSLSFAFIRPFAFTFGSNHLRLASTGGKLRRRSPGLVSRAVGIMLSAPLSVISSSGDFICFVAGHSSARIHAHMFRIASAVPLSTCSGLRTTTVADGRAAGVSCRSAGRIHYRQIYLLVARYSAWDFSSLSSK